ncbi:MAG: hypothetical protein WBG86_06310 [Polyangiales bacterium]
MSSLKRFVRREIIGREKVFVARVISDPVLIDFDESVLGAPVWVVDLDIGGNRPVKNVPIKADGSGGRFYAQLNQTVQVRRTALGRMYVVGPGDVSIASLTDQVYDLNTLQPGASTDTGFTREFEPFRFYQGPASVLGNPDITFAVEGGDDSITRSSGSYIVDGFVIGQTIEIQRTTANDGQLTVTAVSALVVNVSETLVNEGPVSSIGMGAIGTSLWADNQTFFPFSRLVDANGNPV